MSMNAAAPQRFETADALFVHAFALHRQGRLKEAKRLYEQVLESESMHFASLHLLGVIAAQENNFLLALELISRAIDVKPNQAEAYCNHGNVLKELKRFDEALSSYDKAIALKPDYAQAYSNRGVVLNELKRFEECLACLAKAIALRPDYAEAYFNRGLVLQELGRLPEAVASHDQALAIHPGYAQAYFSRGNALKESGLPQEALASYGKAIEITPYHFDSHFYRGVVLHELNRPEEALASYDRAVEMNPRHFEAVFYRGVVLHELKHLGESLASYDKAIEINSGSAEVYLNRGNLLEDMGDFMGAVVSYDKAIAIRPDFALAYANRGAALRALGREEEALTNCDKAIAIEPDSAQAWANRGAALQALNRMEDALTCYDKATDLNSNYALAYWNKALALLLMGWYGQGWELYEWRWQVEHFFKFKRSFAQPLWLGREDVNGKSVLLHAEQGLGDTIQFCRYAKLVKAQGARVSLVVPSQLLGLLSQLDGVDHLADHLGGDGQAMPNFDYHCPLLSMPLAFGTELKSIPQPTAYLGAPPAKREEWEHKLGEKLKLRIGLVWRGSSENGNDHNRSIPLEQFLPHLPDCHEYVSLQKEMRVADEQALVRSGIRHYGQALEDFTDTAALCELMDLVISVDTSVAHLSGAMGKKTWILLPFAPDWRWMLDRQDSPWYASVTLYRQDERRNWFPVLERLRNDLKQLARQQPRLGLAQ